MRVLATSIFLLAAPLAAPAQAQKPWKPNVVVILADDLGYPARTGITAPAYHLPAVQLEKRLVAGAPKSRVLGTDSLTRLKGEYVTLVEAFKEAGYATAHFGKWHLGYGPGTSRRTRASTRTSHTRRRPPGRAGYFAPWKFVTDPEFKGQPGEHIDEWMAGKAAKFVAAQKGKRFYLNFWLYSVHGSPSSLRKTWPRRPRRVTRSRSTGPNSPATGNRHGSFTFDVRDRWVLYRVT